MALDREKPPGFRLPAILKARDRAYGILEGLAGVEPVGEGFDRLRAGLSGVLKRSPDDPVVLETARSVPVKKLTAQAVYDLAWRLAANADLAARGLPIRPWAGQAAPEWVAFEILTAGYSRSPKFGYGVAVSSRAMTGTPCGATVRKFWTTASYRRYARLLGFNPKGRKPIFLKDPRELVRLRFAAIVEAGEQVSFRGLAVPPALRAFNRKLLVLRIRREPPCPYGYKHACRDCPVGYASEPGCDRACHPKTWRRDHCRVCGVESWFGESGPDRCEACARKAAVSPR